MSKVSVVIVTKDRSDQLIQCLGSLIGQSQKIDELVIIDNNSSDNTAEVVKALRQRVSFPVKRFLEKKTGYPSVYNRGLREANYDWVAFIDDDCIADIDWYKHLKIAIKRQPKVAAILGQSKTLSPNNVYSLTTLFFDTVWKEGNISGNTILDTEILDNKNIAYHKKFLNAHNLAYDESRIDEFNGASEDCDLGMQIGEAGGKAVYAKNCIVFHKDPDNITWYYKKLSRGTQGHLTYEKKWSGSRKSSRSIAQKLWNGKRTFENLSEEYSLSLVKKMHLLSHIFLSYLVVGWLRLRNKMTL